MNYFKRIGIFFSAIVLLLGIMVISGSAQTRNGRRVVYKRPIIVRTYVRDPFWYSRAWYDPFYDPYFYDPYLRERRERYYKEKAVRDASRKLKKDQEKYYADGYLTAKERKKLAERQEKYSKAVQKLRKFNAES